MHVLGLNRGSANQMTTNMRLKQPTSKARLQQRTWQSQFEYTPPSITNTKTVRSTHEECIQTCFHDINQIDQEGEESTHSNPPRKKGTKI